MRAVYLNLTGTYSENLENHENLICILWSNSAQLDHSKLTLNWFNLIPKTHTRHKNPPWGLWKWILTPDYALLCTQINIPDVRVNLPLTIFILFSQQTTLVKWLKLIETMPKENNVAEKTCTSVTVTPIVWCVAGYLFFFFSAWKNSMLNI